MIKICKILFCFENNLGGETIILDLLLKEIKKIDKYNVVSKKHDPLTILDSKSSFIFWHIKSLVHWLKFILLNLRFNYLFTTTYTCGFVASLLKIPFNFRLGYLYHGSRLLYVGAPDNVRRLFVPRIQQHFVYLMHKIFINNCDYIIVPSKNAKLQFLSNFPFSKNKNILTIHNGIDLKKFSRPKQNVIKNLKSKYKIRPKSKILLYTGRINKNKHIDKLLRVFKIIKKTSIDTFLIIAHPNLSIRSEQFLKNKLTNLISKHKLGGNVIWFENINSINELYWISDLTVSLSKKETFSLVMLEAFASRTIFMSTKVGATKEVLPQIDSQLIIPFKDNDNEIATKIIKILNLSLSDKLRIINKQNKIVKKFSIKKMADDFQLLLQ